ncbi:transcription antitermination factor NusB [Janibacter massiliensis]|uniref:transcription antitermination factor NusB n=1 Tax=Janibacter massiliensis TaxID=2058291 RepID=UPI000D112551|nr:transcription antitermination factor NusB [Janibacter massiliensis]
MAARTKARKRALDVLFEAEQRRVDPVALVRDRSEAPVTEAPLNPYTVQIVEGVTEHGAQIDDALRTYSQGWTLDRMPDVDRAILRIGAWEILHNEQVPDAVAISEAIGLATELSTDDSPRFVHGLLARVAEVKDTLS